MTGGFVHSPIYVLCPFYLILVKIIFPIRPKHNISPKTTTKILHFSQNDINLVRKTPHNSKKQTHTSHNFYYRPHETPKMMDVETPAMDHNGGDAMEVDNEEVYDDYGASEDPMFDENAPVTQEDAWAVIS